MKLKAEQQGILSLGVTWLLLGLILVYSLVRARIQPIAHDEALTFVSYVSPGLARVWQFSPNNHLLFTLAAAVCIRLFGVSEFVLRIPSLFGLVFYLTASYLLSRRLFDKSILLPVSVLLLVCNPLALDFLIAARGYGLGLGFFALAMAAFADLASAESLGAHSTYWRWKCVLASVCLGLSVSANLSFTIPAISLAVSFAMVIRKRLPVVATTRRQQAVFFLEWLVVPGLIAGLCVLGPYLLQARPTSFAFGYEKGSVFLRELFNSSFLYKWTDETYANLGGLPLATHSWQYYVSTFGAFVVLPVLALLMMLGFASAGDKAKSFEENAERQAWRRLFCGAATGCIVLLCVVHLLLHDKYPVVRSCLYLIPLVTISVLILGSEYRYRLSHATSIAGLLIALALGCDYLASLQMGRFRYNVYDARSREAFLSIFNDVQTRGLKDARVTGTWWYEPEMNFYRTRFKASEIDTYDVNDPFSGPRPTEAPDGYDYICFLQDAAPEPGGRVIRVVFHDQRTGIVIAALEN